MRVCSCAIVLALLKLGAGGRTDPTCVRTGTCGQATTLLQKQQRKRGMVGIGEDGVDTENATIAQRLGMQRSNAEIFDDQRNPSVGKALGHASTAADGLGFINECLAGVLASSSDKVPFCWVFNEADRDRCKNELMLVECGPGACAADTATCIQSIVDMVAAAATVAVNVLSMGAGGSATKSVNSIRKMDKGLRKKMFAQGQKFVKKVNDVREKVDKAGAGYWADFVAAKMGSAACAAVAEKTFAGVNLNLLETGAALDYSSGRRRRRTSDDDDGDDDTTVNDLLSKVAESDDPLEELGLNDLASDCFPAGDRYGSVRATPACLRSAAKVIEDFDPTGIVGLVGAFSYSHCSDPGLKSIKDQCTIDQIISIRDAAKFCGCACNEECVIDVSCDKMIGAVNGKGGTRIKTVKEFAEFRKCKWLPDAVDKTLRPHHSKDDVCTAEQERTVPSECFAGNYAWEVGPFSAEMAWRPVCEAPCSSGAAGSTCSCPYQCSDPAVKDKEGGPLKCGFRGFTPPCAVAGKQFMDGVLGMCMDGYCVQIVNKPCSGFVGPKDCEYVGRRRMKTVCHSWEKPCVCKISTECPGFSGMDPTPCPAYTCGTNGCCTMGTAAACPKDQIVCGDDNCKNGRWIKGTPDFVNLKPKCDWDKQPGCGSLDSFLDSYEPICEEKTSCSSRYAKKGTNTCLPSFYISNSPCETSHRILDEQECYAAVDILGFYAEAVVDDGTEGYEHIKQFETWKSDANNYDALLAFKGCFFMRHNPDLETAWLKVMLKQISSKQFGEILWSSSWANKWESGQYAGDYKWPWMLKFNDRSTDCMNFLPEGYDASFLPKCYKAQSFKHLCKLPDQNNVPNAGYTTREYRFHCPDAVPTGTADMTVEPKCYYKAHDGVTGPLDDGACGDLKKPSSLLMTCVDSTKLVCVGSTSCVTAPVPATFSCIDVSRQKVQVDDSTYELVGNIEIGSKVRIVPFPTGFVGKIVAGLRALLHGGAGLGAPVDGNLTLPIDRFEKGVETYDLEMKDGSHVFITQNHDLLAKRSSMSAFAIVQSQSLQVGDTIAKANSEDTELLSIATYKADVTMSFMTIPMGFFVGESGVLIPPIGEISGTEEQYVNLDVVIALANAWGPYAAEIKREHPCLFKMLGPEFQGHSVLAELFNEFLQKHPFEADELDENPSAFMEHIRNHPDDFAGHLKVACNNDHELA